MKVSELLSALLDGAHIYYHPPPGAISLVVPTLGPQPDDPILTEEQFEQLLPEIEVTCAVVPTGFRCYRHSTRVADRLGVKR